MYRPTSLSHYIGQDTAVKQLKILAGAALKRNEVLPHILLSGPPGLGKTTLAQLAGYITGQETTVINGASLGSKRDLSAILASMKERALLFIDEVHRMHTSAQEMLYGALEDGTMSVIIGSGDRARAALVDLPPWTCFAATTRPGLLTEPFRARFRSHIRLEFYSAVELSRIAGQAAELLDCTATNDSLMLIGERSRGTPRQALRILAHMADIAICQGSKQIDESLIRAGFRLLGIHPQGLIDLDITILRLLRDLRGGDPVGLSTLAAATGEESDVLTEVHEPFLLRCGLICKTTRGRELTSAGAMYLRDLEYA